MSSTDWYKTASIQAWDGGAASRPGRLPGLDRRAAQRSEMDAEPGLDDGVIDDDDGEPQLAQPARKKARGESIRKPRRARRTGREEGASSERRTP